MSIELRVPPLPESVTDATLITWHKKPGDSIARDENLVDLETDKVVLEVPSPVDGVLNSITAQEGDTVTADEILGIIEKGTATTKPVKETPVNAAEADPVLTPAVRHLVKEMKLNPADIPGTGKDGRILKSDVMAYLDENKLHDNADISASEPLAVVDDRNEQRVPMSRLRKTIAHRLVEAQQTAAILTTFNEVNLQEVIRLRQKYRDSFEKTHDIRLGFMSFFVQASVEALKRFPAVNASIDGDDIVYHNYFDIGVAISSPRGLVVPILRDANDLTFADVEKSIADYGKKAQTGSLNYDDLTGGTFSITNGGIFGSMLSTPILNPPQSAILGMHNITERPVVENGEIVIRPMMYLALSYDHRIIDGKEAVQFLVTIKECLEDPAKLLLRL